MQHVHDIPQAELSCLCFEIAAHASNQFRSTSATGVNIATLKVLANVVRGVVLEEFLIGLTVTHTIRMYQERVLATSIGKWEHVYQSYYLTVKLGTTMLSTNCWRISSLNMPAYVDLDTTVVRN